MAYATPAEMRAAFPADGFGASTLDPLSDAALEVVLERASTTIDRYRIGGTPIEDEVRLLRQAALVLARAYVFEDSALTKEHPIVREHDEVMRWLELLAKGEVRRPVEGAAPTLRAPARVFGADVLDRY